MALSVSAADALGITAALDVEHAVVRPSVLIIADQLSLRIGREAGLTGAAQAEEQGCVAARADIRRAVHALHAFQRKKEVHDREDRFLELSCVPGSDGNWWMNNAAKDLLMPNPTGIRVISLVPRTMPNRSGEIALLLSHQAH